MNQIRNLFKPPLGLLFALVTFVAGCGGSMDPVLGTPGAGSVAPPATVPPVSTDTTRPTVTSTIPVSGAADVPTNRKVTAAFSEDMSPASISTASFTVRNTALDSPVAGTVTYSVSARTARKP